ncbi:DUF4113 domain-containing protein (plasmid) [Hymenobacter sp. HDW8]|nr:DUF4113 domain-containing protein [Hymenobacter sp. HDW8]
MRAQSTNKLCIFNCILYNKYCTIYPSLVKYYVERVQKPATGQQLDLFATAPAVKPIGKPVLVTKRPALVASLDALNQRFGRGTVRIATAVPSSGHSATTSGHNPPPWTGKAQ